MAEVYTQLTQCSFIALKTELLKWACLELLKLYKFANRIASYRIK